MPRRYWIALLVYLVLGAIFVHDWDGYVFETSVRDFAAGKSPYGVAESRPYYSFLNPTDRTPQWYAYPPLPLLAMTATFSPAFAMPLAPFVERLLIKAPIILGTLALAAVAGAWARRLGADDAHKARVERLFLFNPFLVLVGPIWGMTDTSLMALLLGGALLFEQGRFRLAGTLFGASVLVKPFPLLLALPLAAYYAHRHGGRAVLRSAATAAAVVVGVCLPFILPNPRAFWNQVVGVHLTRDPQGLTVWSIGSFAEREPALVSALSIGAIAISLLVLSLNARGLRENVAPLVILLAASSQILLWNRVVNEQYLVMAIAPLLLLYGTNLIHGRVDRHAAVLLPALFAVITAIRGFHFLRFIPPDVGAVLFRRPEWGKYDVTIVANRIRKLFDFGWTPSESLSEVSDTTPAVLVALLLVLLAVVGWSLYFRHIAPRPGRRYAFPFDASASAIGCVLLLVIGAAPLVSPAAVPEDVGVPAFPENPRVGAFYYLWWDNPAHDPFLDRPYGNWWQASQFPSLGYYTQTRGIASTHAKMMRENGIEVAIVSYHTGELDRYRTFQEEAAKEGVLVAPLIELNQIYDQKHNRPFNFSRQPEKHASYSLSNGTRDEVANYVLEVKANLRQENTYRVDGRPVIFFYDSYVSDVGFRDEERADLALALLATHSIDELRYLFNDPGLEPTLPSLLQHYPLPGRDSDNDSAFYNGFGWNNTDGSWPDHAREFLNLAAPWRKAHFELHRAWWNEVRAQIEREVGPVFLVSGDAWNEQAGFYAGTIKNIADLQVFNGSFIYSPSFTWGVQPRDPKHVHYDDYFSLWTYRNLWLTAFGNGMDRFSAFGVAPAYDDTRLIVRNNSHQNIAFKIPPADLTGRSTYERSWEATLQAPPSLAIVATFNEFFEGSSVEPSREYGSTFLNTTKTFHDRLANQADPEFNVLVVVHERASRLQYVRYSETDNPHYWGLKLIAAAATAFPGARIEALDGLQEEHLDALSDPDLLLIDGARDDYTLSPEVVARLHDLRAAGVPALIVGREVAEPLRDLVPISCATAGPAPLRTTVRGEEAATPGISGHDDQVNVGDLIRGGTGPQARLLLMDRPGQAADAIIGQRCEEASVAFINLKPWLPLDDKSNALNWSRADCLGTALLALLPEVVTVSPGTPLECRVE